MRRRTEIDRRQAATIRRPLQFTSLNCSTLEEAHPRSLGFTYWFTPADQGVPYSLPVRFVGRRQTGSARPTQEDTFEVLKEVSPIYPGTGTAALTVRVNDLPDGRWEVTALPGRPTALGYGATSPSQAASGGAVGRGGVHPIAKAVGTPIFAPVARVKAPGARLGAWPGLVGSGVVLALGLQGLLAAHAGLPVMRLLSVTALACIAGLLGAKAYYLIGHPSSGRSLLTPGMSVQGFVIAAFAMIALGSLLFDVPPGPVLDISVPALLAGMAVGRLGCFFGGCCVGRPTGSAWGLWCSDRAWGTRRVPVQLFESAGAAVLALLGAIAALRNVDEYSGLLFVSVMSTYVLLRQLLFPLRAIPRATRYGRPFVLVISAMTALVSTVLVIVR